MTTGSSTLKILMVTPEVVPFAKVGGLGDVVGALTEELSRNGHDVRVVCPKYGCIQPGADWESLKKPLNVKLSKGVNEECQVWQTTFSHSEATAYFLEYGKYYDRPEVYSGPWGAHEDNDERFTFLSRAAIDLCYHLKWVPDVIHCHDWTTGLVPVYLSAVEAKKRMGEVATVFTIHNLEHQGVFGQEVLEFAGLPESVFKPDCLESMGQVNMMKGGILTATKLTTVSPTYAEEIQGPEHGCGLNHVLKHRNEDLLGVLNGIDQTVWDPQKDEYLPANYGISAMEGKAVCKRVLQEAMGLEVKAEVPIFAAVARLYYQKGLDLLAELLPEVLSEMAIQVVILGQGEDWLEGKFKELAADYPGRVGVQIAYAGELAHRIYAGADFFVMPSRFEPCGLSQLYAMAYGTPPIVRGTGGLADTVTQYTEGDDGGTGFIFESATTEDLKKAMSWASATYYDQPQEYRKMQLKCMEKDFSWGQSAAAYEGVYWDAVTAMAKEGEKV